MRTLAERADAIIAFVTDGEVMWQERRRYVINALRSLMLDERERCLSICRKVGARPSDCEAQQVEALIVEGEE